MSSEKLTFSIELCGKGFSLHAIPKRVHLQGRLHGHDGEGRRAGHAIDLLGQERPRGGLQHQD